MLHVQKRKLTKEQKKAKKQRWIDNKKERYVNRDKLVENLTLQSGPKTFIPVKSFEVFSFHKQHSEFVIGATCKGSTIFDILLTHGVPVWTS